MAGLRSRPDSARRARGLSVSDDGRSIMLRRWDGLSRSCRDWESLRRDPEIWERNGNCLVHLYGRGESKRGPSFKLPFTALLSSGCFPLIKRFSVLDGLQSRTLAEIERWDQHHPRSTVELFIPTPPRATERQAFRYLLAMRNLFAWVLGRPLVGEHLGTAMVALMHSLHEFRSTPEDSSADDLTRYLQQAGYLNMAEEPGYALAVLHLAETFKMKELYLRAFAHCVGMHERLFCSSESQLTSPTSRKLIRKARIGMNAAMLQTSDWLTTFLDEELSEAHLGIPPGTRAHLERFRSFLLSFYATKLGYYPPKAFSASLLRTMASDFEALYELLVDNNYTASDIIPSTAVGGICTEQLIQSFDERNKLKPLQHPLPQLPQIQPHSGFRRLSWLPFGEKVTSGQRQVTLAALIKASNWTEKSFKNDLVRAYRQFEEDSVLSPNKVDKNEKVSMADARKVRWIVIYSVYQVLRRATTPPEEVRHSQTSYHLTVSMDNLPPWRESYRVKDLVRRQTELITENVLDAVKADSASQEEPARKIEIKPDVDYFALTHKDRCSSLSNMSDTPSVNLSRSSSFSMGLRRNSTFRRSLRKFRSPSISESQPPSPPQRPLYHEIVVEGYGNGTHDVIVEPDEGLMMKGCLAGRSDSTSSSQSNSSSDSSSDSMSSTIDTLPSTAVPSPTSTIADPSPELELMLARWGPQDKTPVRMSMLRSVSATAVTDALENLVEESHNYTEDLDKSNDDKNDDVKIKRRSLEPLRSAPATALAGLQRRYTILGDTRRKAQGLESKPIPVRIRENSIDEEPWDSRRNSDDWSTMQSFMDGRSPKADAMSQYEDLGGLTDMR